jgi:acetylglutamate kinase
VLRSGAKSVVIVGKLGEGDLVRAILAPGAAGTVLVSGE